MVLSDKKLLLSPTFNTPEVIIDPAGYIKLRGKLISENPETFFITVKKLMLEHFDKSSEITAVEVSLEYINSVGLKFLLDLIDEINQTNLKNKKREIRINWYSEHYDEDIFDKGTMLSSILNVPFNFMRVA
jgi:hypothetical protein